MKRLHPGGNVGTVALVGGDGAGKTTIAKYLEKSAQFPCKYLYMGVSPLSSNRALPISRLARFLKIRSYKKAISGKGKNPAQQPSSHNLYYRQVKRGPIFQYARLLNRLIEASYRHFLAMVYQLRGYIVIFDRFFTFEAVLGANSSQAGGKRRIVRLEYWLMKNLFPEPDLVIYLDAPPEILYQRKGEATLEYLAKRTTAMLLHGKNMDNFIRVDAVQPLDHVLADVTNCILEFRRTLHK
jgi:thymidylate kinase